jgi:hypothetical protein
MWQVEDIIRAYSFDIEKIQGNIIDKYNQDAETKKEMKQWYQNLIDMMNLEGIRESGHLQINKNVVDNLTSLHNRLLKSPQESFYISSYYNVLPVIVELRAKSNEKNVSEIETCLSALYGFLLLKIQKKEITQETQNAITQISSLVRTLAEKFRQEENGELELNS